MNESGRTMTLQERNLHEEFLAPRRGWGYIDLAGPLIKTAVSGTRGKETLQIKY